MCSNLVKAAHSERKAGQRKQGAPGLSERSLPLELRPINPWPPLDRRWQIARYFATSAAPVPEHLADKWVLRALEYLSAPATRRRSDKAPLKHCLAIAGAAPCCASSGLTTVIYEVAARLLAGETDDEIGQKLDLRAEHIRTYERLFYCVRERLTAPSYIAHFAIGPPPNGPLEKLGHLWKQFGYFRGRLVLDLLVGAFRDLPATTQGKGIGAYNSRLCPPIVRLVVRAATLNVGSGTLTKAQQILRELQSLEQSENSRLRSSPEQLAELAESTPIGKLRADNLATESICRLPTGGHADRVADEFVELIRKAG